MTDAYATHAKGIRILPGQWRPHYPFEQVVWINLNTLLKVPQNPIFRATISMYLKHKHLSN